MVSRVSCDHHRASRSRSPRRDIVEPDLFRLSGLDQDNNLTIINNGGDEGVVMFQIINETSHDIFYKVQPHRTFLHCNRNVCVGCRATNSARIIFCF